MAESSGEHVPRWYDDLEPRRHMIAERSTKSSIWHEAKNNTTYICNNYTKLVNIHVHVVYIHCILHAQCVNNSLTQCNN